jgi:membrane-bound serine protease (ClpP class)
MKIVIGLCLSILILIGFGVVTAETTEAGSVTVLTVEREITAGTVTLIERGLRLAEQNSSTHFILELNTPGGLLKATEEISRLLVDSPLTTVVYVHKDTGWAFSAGTYILFSADIAVSNPTATIGAALPVSGGESAPDKVVEASAAWLLSLVERRGGFMDGAFVRELVTESKTISGQAAYEMGLIDLIASSRSDLLEALNLATFEVTSVQSTLVDEFLALASLPYLVPLLLSLGALGIFLMFRTGELELFGLLGVVFLLLGLWGMGAIQLSVLGTLLLGLGIILLLVELLFSPGFGVVGGIGVVSFLIGIMTFANEPLYPSYFISTVFYIVLGVCAGMGVLMTILGRLSYTALRLPVVTGKEAVLGKEAVVLEGFGSNGAVEVQGERYVARSVSGKPYEVGDKVRVEDLQGNTILVE